MTVVLLGAASAGPANAQTLFTTDEIRADRERWTDPAYYHNNTVAEMRDMDRAAVPGAEGTGRATAIRIWSRADESYEFRRVGNDNDEK